jgi:oxygen-dependent protoporphyrinogen oxidase
MKDVVIVGSGISGLSVARWLREAGLNPVVYEKEDRIGGNVWTESSQGFTYELGPQTLLADEEVKDFLRTFSIDYQKASPSSRNRYIYRGGRLIPIPLTPIGFLKTPLLSLGAKLRVLKEPWVPPGIGISLPPLYIYLFLEEGEAFW